MVEVRRHGDLAAQPLDDRGVQLGRPRRDSRDNGCRAEVRHHREQVREHGRLLDAEPVFPGQIRRGGDCPLRAFRSESAAVVRSSRCVHPGAGVVHLTRTVPRRSWPIPAAERSQCAHRADLPRVDDLDSCRQSQLGISLSTDSISRDWRPDVRQSTGATVFGLDALSPSQRSTKPSSAAMSTGSPAIGASDRRDRRSAG